MDRPPPPDPLSSVLQQWRLQPPVNPGFRPAVWQRLGRGAQESWLSYAWGHRLGLSVATLMVVGAASWTGHVAAQAKAAAEREAMVVTYLVGLDPRVQARLRP